MMKDQFVLHLDPLFASSDLRGMACSSKAKAAKTAMVFSRTNTLLSLPMLLSMVAAQNLY